MKMGRFMICNFSKIFCFLLFLEIIFGFKNFRPKTLIHPILTSRLESIKSQNRKFLENQSPKKLLGKISDKISRINLPNNKRKHRYPQRKLKTIDLDEAGLSKPLLRRVSVYCVGSSIDLEGLRAHIFRRGFSQISFDRRNHTIPHSARNTSGENVPSEDQSLNLSLDPFDRDEDEDILHVSNSPTFINQLESRVGLMVSKDEYQKEVQKADMSDFDEVNNVLDEEHPPNYSNNEELDIHKGKRKTQRLIDAYHKWTELAQDIFYFQFGCVVFWGLSKREEKAALTELTPFISEPVNADELEDCSDFMEFMLDRAESRNTNPSENDATSSLSKGKPIQFDRIKLKSTKVEEKMAFSYAMAQSSKLFVFESKVLKSVELTRYLPKELALKGRISCNKKQLNQLIGQLFVEQTEVNLFSSILDSPEFLWDDDQFFPSYEFARSYLEVDDRVELLNSRLAVIRELLDVLTAQVEDNNSTRLEWIVIWLISIEIIMGIAANPLFAGKRLFTALLVPTAILIYKKLDSLGLA